MNPVEVAHTPPFKPIIAAFETLPLPSRLESTYAAKSGVDMLIYATDEGITLPRHDLHTGGRRAVNDEDEDVVDL